jgi:hypothetical protein
MLIAITLALFVVMFLLELVGYRRGRRRAALATGDLHEGLGVVEGAVFALLGLMLAFLFSGAAGRLNDRRGVAIREANAVGTAWLRLDLLPPPDAARLRDTFRDYTEARIRSIEHRLESEASDTAARDAERLQQAIWSDAVVVSQAVPDREVEQLLIQALNDMIDVATERDTLAKTHAALPIQVFLFFLAMAGAVLAGFSMSRTPQFPMLHMLLFAAVTAATIYCILDMEYPRLGLIRIGEADRPMQELLESMKR